MRHKAGDKRPAIAQPQEVMTLSILIEGRFRIEFGVGHVVLEQQGDYVLFGPEEHAWAALEDVLILVVRWPLKTDKENT